MSDLITETIKRLKEGEPPDLVVMMEQIYSIGENPTVWKALEAAFYLGRMSLICYECGDYIIPDDAYCDCWRDKR